MESPYPMRNFSEYLVEMIDVEPLPCVDEDVWELHRVLYRSMVVGMFRFYVEHGDHNIAENLHVYYVISQPKPENKEGTVAVYPFGEIGMSKLGTLELIHIEVLSIEQVIGSEKEDLQLRLQTSDIINSSAIVPHDLYLFDPTHHLAGAWLATLRAQQYDDHEARINIPARMGGDAHHWYSTYVWVDLPTSERDFMNRFDYVHPEQALYMIKDRVQKPLESVAEYRNRFYRMFVKTERGEQVGRDLFIDGLRSRTIRTKLRKQFSPITHTLQQIMAVVEEMERKFAANFLEGEDYPRDGDLTELVRARAELTALQNKFENMGFVSGPVTYMEQWVRCPMGICNAPATFQRAMNMTFQNFVNKTRLTQGMINFCVIVYMDDILVYSETYHGHAQHIEWTLGALRDVGFKIALEKSEIFVSEISFLGYVVTRGGLRPDSRKVAAVKEAPIPTSLTQVRAFLGLASYYRRFIKGFASIARPLTNLLRKDQPLSWDAECQQAFATLKDALAMAPILIRPDPSKQFILITDWQPEAISAILAQKGNDGREHVIEFASRTVPDERRNDSAPQGECYAVVWGIQHFHPYLYGQKFHLVTDHEPLLALKKLTNCTGMIGRWAKEPRNASRRRSDNIWIPRWFPILPSSGSQRRSSLLPSKRRKRRKKALRVEDEREESEKGDEVLGEEDETPEEGSHSEHSEGEQSEEEEEDKEGEEGHEEESVGSEWETVSEEALCTGTEAEGPEAARKREEIAAEKELELASAASLQICDDPNRDPEPPRPEDGDLAATTPASSARRRS
ncbi:hypothetical protein CBR_g36674 [Chara braunii]|uniref:Reverse transcriptase domain-containing protein n=1 Tax=Chara braunii TaxID=69332 RepID=A0A388LL87_CHABU|nr:hypothetical protein CBR_g36674 [Chara braunii]|eukprot:GBG83057.1 hypothetical protein CBR_g36674 [Chara braunii]